MMKTIETQHSDNSQPLILLLNKYLVTISKINILIVKSVNIVYIPNMLVIVNFNANTT